MQLPVLVRTPGAGNGRVVFGQELLVKPVRQDRKNLDRIIWVVFVRKLRCHIIHHHSTTRLNTAPHKNDQPSRPWPG